VVGVLVLVSIVPLATWAATGSLRQAWRALRGYALVLTLLGGTALLGVLIAGIGLLMA